MKLKFIKDCKYAFDHINPVSFLRDDIRETEHEEFIRWALSSGLAEEVVEELPVTIKPKKKATPKANKKAKGPDENK